MGQVLEKFRTKHQPIEVDGSCARRKANKKFNVRICDDVLIGVLSFGRRRYFAMLEPHGTRFQCLIERYWPEAPLLILDMDCWTYEKDDDKIFGISIGRPLQPLLDRLMLPLDHVFSSVPRFLRFGNVKVNPGDWTKLPISMAERREIHIPLLQQLAPAFRGCSLTFYSEIIVDMCEKCVRTGCCFGFPNHQTHLEYIRDRLIPQLFDNCSSYSFRTEILNNDVDGCPDIAGLLAIDAIKRCNRVDMNTDNGFDIHDYGTGIPLKCPCCDSGKSNSTSNSIHPFCLPPSLPINEISAWLHKPSEKHGERFLSIDMDSMENVHEMIKLLKMQLQEATSPTGHAFTLKLMPVEITHLVEIVEETLKNTRTNEELSISCQFDNLPADPNWDGYPNWDDIDCNQGVTIRQAHFA